MSGRNFAYFVVFLLLVTLFFALLNLGIIQSSVLNRLKSNKSAPFNTAPVTDSNKKIDLPIASDHPNVSGLSISYTIVGSIEEIKAGPDAASLKLSDRNDLPVFTLDKNSKVFGVEQGAGERNLSLEDLKKGDNVILQASLDPKTKKLSVVKVEKISISLPLPGKNQPDIPPPPGVEKPISQ